MKTAAQEVLDLLASRAAPKEAAFNVAKEAEKIYNTPKFQKEFDRLCKKWPKYNSNSQHEDEVVDELDDFVMEQGFLDPFSEDEAELLRDELKSMVHGALT